MGKITIPSVLLTVSPFLKGSRYLLLIVFLFSINSLSAQSIPQTNVAGPEGLPCAVCAPAGWQVDLGTPDSGDEAGPANNDVAGNNATFGGRASWVAPGSAPTAVPLPADTYIVPLPPNGHTDWLSLRDLGTAGTEEIVSTNMTGLTVGRDYEVVVYSLTSRTHGNGGAAANEFYSGDYNDFFTFRVSRKW